MGDRRRCCSCCSRAALGAFLILSAVPLALIVALERTKSAGESFEYRSLGWVRECAKWDDGGRRFLISTFFGGGVSEVAVGGGGPPAALEERPVLQDAEVRGNGSVGILLDRRRGRLLVTYADLLGNRYAALGAYDLASWRRLSLTQLSGPGDELCLADDVAVDDDGNAYVTDAKANKIWKVAADGRLLSTIRDPAFTQGLPWYSNLVGLNGIVFHPDGYLLVIHTLGGRLFKLDAATGRVSAVEITGGGSLVMGDGLALLSPTKLAVAGTPSGRVVESSDGWATAAVTARYRGPMHRIASSATVKDGKVYLSHLVGGLPRRTHLITEAVFHPVNAK